MTPTKMLSTAVLLVTFLIITSVLATPRIDPLVNTKVGLIKGLVSDNGQYSMFMGIPYGVVDAKNPFGVSTPHPGFEEDFEAYDDSTVCPQPDSVTGRIIGTIHCLHLSVYVPSTANSRNKLPVLVWIHGGAFKVGSKSVECHGPKHLMNQEVILVTINYRLGPYGFMCLDIPEVPGNQGLKDQLLAIKWVKDNIAAFGGDDNKITIGGWSAGAMSTGFHVLYAKENLFDKAILQAGTALSPVMPEPMRDLPMILAANLGFNTTDIYEALNFIADVDSNLVIGMCDELNLKPRICVENKFDETEGYILENWLNLDKNPRIKNMPILTGFTEDEKSKSDHYSNPEFYKYINIVDTFMSSAFDFEDGYFTEMVDIVRHFYFGDEGEKEETSQQIIDLDSDFTNNHPTYRTIDKLIENDAGNIYFYLFTYMGSRSGYFRHEKNEDRKTSHGDELVYLFDFSSAEDTIDDQLVTNRVTTLWANFLKYGNPTPEITELLPVKWEPNIAGSPRYYLNIGKNMAISSRPMNERMTFWDLFYKMNGHLARHYTKLD